MRSSGLGSFVSLVAVAAALSYSAAFIAKSAFGASTQPPSGDCALHCDGSEGTCGFSYPNCNVGCNDPECLSFGCRCGVLPGYFFCFCKKP